MLTVLIADDHPLVLNSIRTMIGAMEGMEVVAEAGNGLEVVSEARRTRPDLAIIDINMPHANGIDAFIELKRWSPKTRVVVLTGISANSLFAALLDAGVDGLFLKSGQPEALEAGIRKVIKGGRAIADEVRAIVEQVKTVTLTKRELQVLQAIARGETNVRMADRMNLSPKTVDTHRTNLMRKLGVNSAASLLTEALRAGLIERPDGT